MIVSSKNKVEVSVSNKTIIRVIVMVVATFAVLKVVASLSHVLSLFFISMFLALALNPAVSYISHHLKIKSRALATAIAYVIVLMILTVFVVLVVPPLARQTVDFVSNLPGTIENFRASNPAVEDFIRKYSLEHEFNNIVIELRGYVKYLPEPVLSTASRIGSTLISVVTVLILTFMMLIEGPAWVERILQLQSAEKQARTKTLLKRMHKVVTGYVNGQLLIALIAAVFAMVALLITSTVLDVTINAVALAGIVALMGLIPMIGNTLGAVLVVLICLITSLPLAIIMGIFFLVYQQVENATLQPYIQSRSNELSPMLVFMAAITGVAVAGLLGGLVAIPVAGCLKILFDEVIASRLAARK